MTRDVSLGTTTISEFGLIRWVATRPSSRKIKRTSITQERGAETRAQADCQGKDRRSVEFGGGSSTAQYHPSGGQLRIILVSRRSMLRSGKISCRFARRTITLNTRHPTNLRSRRIPHLCVTETPSMLKDQRNRRFLFVPFFSPQRKKKTADRNRIGSTRGQSERSEAYRRSRTKGTVVFFSFRFFPHNGKKKTADRNRIGSTRGQSERSEAYRRSRPYIPRKPSTKPALSPGDLIPPASPAHLIRSARSSSREVAGLWCDADKAVDNLLHGHSAEGFSSLRTIGRLLPTRVMPSDEGEGKRARWWTASEHYYVPRILNKIRKRRRVG